MENNTKPYVLVTGASSGVGRDVSILLSEEYNLIIHGRDYNRLAETRELCTRLNSEVKLWQCDFSDISNIEESLKAFLCNEKIKVHSYVHSAGMMLLLPLKALTYEKIQEVMNINFYSAVVISKALSQNKYNGKELKNIVYVSSNISNRGARAFTSYGASKGALDAFMRSLAVELAPKVRVNSVLPGGMRTNMTEQIFQDQDVARKMEKQYPLGLGVPNNIATVIKFLISNDSCWITGQQITIDGGCSINISG